MHRCAPQPPRSQDGACRCGRHAGAAAAAAAWRPWGTACWAGSRAARAAAPVPSTAVNHLNRSKGYLVSRHRLACRSLAVTAMPPAVQQDECRRSC